MSTVQKELPIIMQRLATVNTFIISQKLSSGGKVLSAGDYTITDEIDETKQCMNVRSSNEDQLQNNSPNIIDEKGNIILECNHVRSTCLRNVLNIYSPAGFKLGSLRKRLCKCTTEYELVARNRSLLFLLKIDSKPSGFRIDIINVNDQCEVANIDVLASQIDKIEFKLTYIDNIAILQKTLILCAAIACCQQEYNVLTLTNYIRSIVKDMLCCPLFEENRNIFIIVCILFPVLFGLYLFGVLLYVGTFPFFLSMCVSFLIIYPKYRYFSKLVFTWPCYLCGLYKPEH